MEKRDIALLQIRTAAALYVKGNYVCSLTLSGAAEEILGRIAKKRKKFNQLDVNVSWAEGMFLAFDKPVPARRKLIELENQVRNEVKHNDSGENLWVDADFEYEAAIFFVRAVKNYYLAYGEYPKDRMIGKVFNHLTL